MCNNAHIFKYPINITQPPFTYIAYENFTSGIVYADFTHKTMSLLLLISIFHFFYLISHVHLIFNANIFGTMMEINKNKHTWRDKLACVDQHDKKYMKQVFFPCILYRMHWKGIDFSRIFFSLYDAKYEKSERLLWSDENFYYFALVNEIHCEWVFVDMNEGIDPLDIVHFFCQWYGLWVI